MDRLVLTVKGSVVGEYVIEKDVFTIGRDPGNDVRIESQVVSARHARVFLAGDGVTIEDMQSTNGTFVNRRKVVASALNDGDEISIGRHTLTFHTDRPSSQSGADIERTMPIEPIPAPVKPAPSVDAATPAKSAPVPDSEKNASLIMLKGGERKVFALKGRMTVIGRDKNANIKLSALLAPKLAAMINRGSDGYYLSLPAEGAKIKYNGAALKERVALKEGDLIELYGLKLQFVLTR